MAGWFGRKKKLQDEIENIKAGLKPRPRSPFSRSLFRSSNLLKKYGLDL